MLRAGTFSSPGGAICVPGCQATASCGQLQTAVCAAVNLIRRRPVNAALTIKGNLHLPSFSLALGRRAD
jgi:hypothetical protein